MKTILAIDQGTTGTRAFLMNENLEVLSQAYEEFPQYFPKPGWVEHSPEEIWQSTLKTISQAISNNPHEIVAIGITNQRETLCFWDKSTGLPTSRAIVWQDRRTSDFCESLKEKGLEPKFQKKTGLLLDPYFSGSKAAWALKNDPEVQSLHSKGKLAIGTIDSYLMARLSGGKSHVTEPSNASRTLAFDIEKENWSDELSTYLGVPTHLWPETKDSMGLFTKTFNVPGLPDGIPVTGVLGDQQSALLGQACIEEGMAKCTYGTGAFLLMNTGNKKIESQNRLLSTIAWKLSGEKPTYALEGSAFVAGAAVQWLRDGLQIINHSSEIEPLALQVEESDGLIFVPALTGLGAPHWNPKATGMFTGIHRGTTKSHFARAVLEGIAFQNSDILSAMETDLHRPLISLNVDGGASKNKTLMQFQSDILNVPLNRPQMIESTVLGAVFAAGMGVGLWSSLKDIQKVWKKDCTFEPSMEPETRNEHLLRWKKAIQRVSL
tara:strand:+ start:3186 stop:4661 length:1476 start_codon:yes stop_codon:yes gene_type:complete